MFLFKGPIWYPFSYLYILIPDSSEAASHKWLCKQNQKKYTSVDGLRGRNQHLGCCYAPGKGVGEVLLPFVPSQRVSLVAQAKVVTDGWFLVLPISGEFIWDTYYCQKTLVWWILHNIGHLRALEQLFWREFNCLLLWNQEAERLNAAFSDMQTYWNMLEWKRKQMEVDDREQTAGQGFHITLPQSIELIQLDLRDLMSQVSNQVLPIFTPTFCHALWEGSETKNWLKSFIVSGSWATFRPLGQSQLLQLHRLKAALRRSGTAVWRVTSFWGISIFTSSSWQETSSCWLRGQAQLSNDKKEGLNLEKKWQS